LGRALRGRGHEVTIETWEERRAAVEGAGLGFAAAEEYRMFPPPDPDSAEGEHAAEAAREYDSELALFPDNFEALTNLGILKMETGEVDQGVEVFRRLVAKQPDSAMSYYLLAKAYATQGRMDDEVQNLAERAVQIDPRLERGRQLVEQLRARRRVR